MDNPADGVFTTAGKQAEEYLTDDKQGVLHVP